MSDFISQFPTCPRCNSSWKGTNDNTYGYTKVCSQCGMRMSGATLRLVVADKWIIFWSNEGSCEIDGAQANPNHISGFAPAYGRTVYISHWLPFTITPERLHLLLVFS
jgi:hypothetical protein